MTGRPFRSAHEDQSVLIAIHQNAIDAQDVPGRFALHPQPPARPRMEMRQARLSRLGECFCVHVGEHENRAAVRVYYDRR